MNKITTLTLVILFASLLAACGGSGIPVTGGQSALQLTVESPDGENAFRQGEEPITYIYVLTNTGSQRLSGPVIVEDLPRQVACPQLDTVGNLDSYLDFNESITCTAFYTLSEAEKSAGSITNRARANVGGAVSNEAGITLGAGPAGGADGAAGTPSAQGSGGLRLETTAVPQTYEQSGDTITYSYVITNTGNAPVGPAQFTINDDRLEAPLNCGPADTTLASNERVTCSASHTVTEDDLNAGEIRSNVTASGGGQTSAAVSTTVTRLATDPLSETPSSASTATPGSSANSNSTQTPSLLTTAIAETLAGSTGTPSVIPTATLFSAGNEAPATGNTGAVNVIAIPAGADAVVVPGIAPANGGIRYSVNATQGQQLSLSFVVTTSQLALVVTGPDGAVLKPGETAMPWSQTVPSTGTYLIEVLSTSATEAQPYMLEVRLTPAD